MTTKKSSKYTTQEDRVAAFFDCFFPERIESLGLCQMESFTITFAFVVNDISDGCWVIRFTHGEFAGIERQSDTMMGSESFAYQMDSDAFWDVVCGKGDPRNVFLSGRAEIVGDVEQALKVGMMLAQFSQMHPYNAQVNTNEPGTDA